MQFFKTLKQSTAEIKLEPVWKKKLMQTIFEVLTKIGNTILIKTFKVWIRILSLKKKDKLEQLFKNKH